MESDSDFGLVVGKGGRLYEILGDGMGKKIWINASDGSAVARFNTNTGVDLHNTVTDQLNGAPECLWCTHEKPSYADWIEFVQKVDDHFELSLSIDAIDVGCLN